MYGMGEGVIYINKFSYFNIMDSVQCTAYRAKPTEQEFLVSCFFHCIPLNLRNSAALFHVQYGGR